MLTEEDGFDINERELRRLRTKNRWFLRSRRGASSPTGEESSGSAASSPAASPNVDGGDETHSLLDAEEETPGNDQSSLEDPTVQKSPDANKAKTPPFAEITLKNSRKDLRPKDANGNMKKFPSEMPVDEAKKVLCLDEKQYMHIREVFQQICHEEGVTKKTQAGPQVWERIKDRLTSDNPHLRQTILIDRENFNAKKLALDIVCTAVTKRIRVAESQVNFGDIKNVLGVNPEDFRQFKQCFHKLLADADFINKSVMTSPYEWEALKRQAAETTGLMHKLRTWGNDPESPELRRALDKLAQYVRKRLKEELAKNAAKQAVQEAKAKAQREFRQEFGIEEPKAKEQDSQSQKSPPNKSETDSRIEEQSGEAPARPSKTDQSRPSTKEKSGTKVAAGCFDGMQDESEASQITYAASGPAVRAVPPGPAPVMVQHQSSRMSGPPNGVPPPQRRFGSTLPTAMPLGPHGAHMGSSMLLQQNSATAYMEHQYAHPQYGVTASSQPAAFHPVPVPSAPPALAMFLRLHPTSTFTTSMAMWIGTLNTASIQELRRAAVEKFPSAICDRIEGMVKYSGGEIPLRVEDDQELHAYLTHVHPGTPTFAVRLMWRA